MRVADEVFIALALLHMEHPGRDHFTIPEIVDRAAREHLHGSLRAGVRVHASLHCVANKAPSPGRHRMLYATGRYTRRLLRSDDAVHPGRTGKIWPKPEFLPARYRDLIEWAKRNYSNKAAKATVWMDGILRMRGMGRELWKDEDPDEYVRDLRRNW